MDQRQSDRFYLAQCLDLAKKAQSRDEVPVGALVVNHRTGEILSKAFNLRESLQTALAHAEILAIHRACKKLGSWRLSGYSLYSSLEPCIMCSGAILQSRIDRVVYSAPDSGAGGQSLLQVFDRLEFNHSVEWTKGDFEEESRRLLKGFFRKKRQENQQREDPKSQG